MTKLYKQLCAWVVKMRAKQVGAALHDKRKRNGKYW